MPSRERSLTAYVKADLNCELSRPNFEAILAFMPGANIELLRHSLKEVRGAAKRTDTSRLLEQLHRSYHRKLAEQASLYPVFHILESAYRAKLGFWLENHYGVDRWWEPILAELRHDRDLTEVNGVAVTHSALRALQNLIKNVEGDRYDRGVLAQADGHGVLARAKMSDIEELIFEHWPNFKKELRGQFSNGSPVEQATFKAKLKRVRDARNEAYHHREVGRRAEIVALAEELLDLIDVHLGSVVDHAAQLAPKVQASGVRVDARHLALCAVDRSFRIETVQQGRDPAEAEVTAMTGGDAIAKSIAGMSGERRAKLQAVRLTDRDAEAGSPQHEGARAP